MMVLVLEIISLMLNVLDPLSGTVHLGTNLTENRLCTSQRLLQGSELAMSVMVLATLALDIITELVPLDDDSAVVFLTAVETLTELMDLRLKAMKPAILVDGLPLGLLKLKHDVVQASFNLLSGGDLAADLHTKTIDGRGMIVPLRLDIADVVLGLLVLSLEAFVLLGDLSQLPRGIIDLESGLAVLLLQSILLDKELRPLTLPLPDAIVQVDDLLTRDVELGHKVGVLGLDLGVLTSGNAELRSRLVDLLPGMVTLALAGPQSQDDALKVRLGLVEVDLGTRHRQSEVAQLRTDALDLMILLGDLLLLLGHAVDGSRELDEELLNLLLALGELPAMVVTLTLLLLQGLGDFVDLRHQLLPLLVEGLPVGHEAGPVLLQRGGLAGSIAHELDESEKLALGLGLQLHGHLVAMRVHEGAGAASAACLSAGARQRRTLVRSTAVKAHRFARRSWIREDIAVKVG